MRPLLNKLHDKRRRKNLKTYISVKFKVFKPRNLKFGFFRYFMFKKNPENLGFLLPLLIALVFLEM